MTITVGFSAGPNDIADAPQAKLQGGPFHNSIIELQEKKCEKVTITEDDTVATYYNTHTTNSSNQHIFTCE